MKKVNWILTLLSLNGLLVTVERFSFTTKVFLQPYNFLRLHELFQMTVIILISVILPFYLLRELTHNFSDLKTKPGFWLGLLFIVGVYFYATGNGLHEVSSHLFNTYCPHTNFSGNLCGSMFFNDYYVGNGFYFIGLFMVMVALILFERQSPNTAFSPADLRITVINSVVYAFLMFAYAAFDVVNVGLIFSVISAAVAGYLLFSAKTKYRFLPFTTYNFIAYTLASIGAFLVRFH